jgi:cadmium resistance transport/sequestration family protein
MDELITAIPTGMTAFAATNIDDIVILMILFTQANTTLRSRHIVIGQYLGFAALVIISLVGFLSGLVFPQRWLGLLGLIPIALGFNTLLNPETDGDEETLETLEQPDRSLLSHLLSPQIYGVAAITIANGSDNIGIYTPLFASSRPINLLIILGIFFLLVGVWCFSARWLTQQQQLAHTLARYGNTLVPFVLIGLGGLIVLNSGALSPLALVASCLCVFGLIKLNGRITEVKAVKEGAIE